MIELRTGIENGDIINASLHSRSASDNMRTIIEKTESALPHHVIKADHSFKHITFISDGVTKLAVTLINEQHVKQ